MKSIIQNTLVIFLFNRDEFFFNQEVYQVFFFHKLFKILIGFLVDNLIQFRNITFNILINEFFIFCVLLESFSSKHRNFMLWCFLPHHVFPVIYNLKVFYDDELLELFIVHVLCSAHLKFDRFLPLVRKHLFPSIRLPLLDILPEYSVSFVNILCSHILEIVVSANLAFVSFLGTA